MIVDNKHSIGDIVYMVTDADQKPYIVVSLRVLRNDVQYGLSCAGYELEYCFDFEISSVRDVVLTTNS